MLFMPGKGLGMSNISRFACDFLAGVRMAFTKTIQEGLQLRKIVHNFK